MASANTWDPSDPDYQRETGLVAAGLIAAGVVTLVAFVLFFFIRFMCCCCGKGACAKNEKAAGKSKAILHRLLALVLMVGALIGGLVLAATGEKFSTSLKGLTHTILDQVELTIADVRNITTAVDNAVPNEFALDISSLSEADNDLEEVSVTLDDARDQLEPLFDLIKNLILGFGAIVVVAAVIGGVSLLRPAPFMLTLFLLLCLVVAPVCWLLSGVGAVTHTTATDVCNMMALHAAGQRNAYIDEQLQCGQLAVARDAANDMMRASNDQIAGANQAIVDANTATVAASLPASAELPELCMPFARGANGDWRVATEQTGNCTAMEPAAVSAAYDPFVCGLPNVNSTSDATYNGCVLAGTPLLRADVDTMVEAATSFEIIADALPTVFFLADCGFVDRAFAAIVADDCDGVQAHTHLLYGGGLAAGFFLTLASLFFCVCFRNLRRQSETRVEYTVGSPTANQPLMAALSPGTTPSHTAANPYFGAAYSQNNTASI